MKMLSFPHWQFTSLTYEAILFFFKNKFNVMIISISRTDYLIGNKQTGLILKQLQEVIDHIWMLRVASVCTPCCMLLRLVGSCCAKFETGQTFSYVQTDATTPNIVGSCRPTILRLLAPGFKSLINEICKFLHRICFTVSLLIPQGHIPLKCNKLPRHLNDENLPQDQEQRCKGLRFFRRESGFRRKRCQASLQVVSIRLHLK